MHVPAVWLQMVTVRARGSQKRPAPGREAGERLGFGSLALALESSTSCKTAQNWPQRRADTRATGFILHTRATGFILHTRATGFIGARSGDLAGECTFGVAASSCAPAAPPAKISSPPPSDRSRLSCGQTQRRKRWSTFASWLHYLMAAVSTDRTSSYKVDCSAPTGRRSRTL